MFDPGPHDDLGILLAMTYTAWADDSLAQAELDLILAEAADQGLEVEEQAVLREALLDRPTAQAVANQLTTVDARKAAWFAAHTTAWADDRVELSELDALTRLADAMELSADDRAEVSAAAQATLRRTRAGDWGSALLLEQALLDDT